VLSERQNNLCILSTGTSHNAFIMQICKFPVNSHPLVVGVLPVCRSSWMHTLKCCKWRRDTCFLTTVDDCTQVEQRSFHRLAVLNSM